MVKGATEAGTVEKTLMSKHISSIKSKIRPFVYHILGDSRNSSVWHDNWSPIGPLDKLISNRDIGDAGFNIYMSVRDIFDSTEGQWPSQWLIKFPPLSQIPHPIFDENKKDSLMWRLSDGNVVLFTVENVWVTIRQECTLVPWAHVVWFSQCIPRHAFILWLAVGQKLQTQDRMLMWSNQLHLISPFCKLHPDIHGHLFFQCDFPRQIWFKLKPLASLDAVSENWYYIMDYIQPSSKCNSVWSIIGRLTLAAAVYHVWKERNSRIHNKGSHSFDQVVQLEYDDVCYKLLSLKFKPTKNSAEATKRWKLGDIRYLIS